MKFMYKTRGFHLVSIIILMMTLDGYGQNYGNEWINPAQKYFKITTAEEGIYRLTYNDLINAGFPANTINPRNIQIFHRGQEQTRFIKDELTGIFNADDYLEFYGKRNDGILDEGLYVTPSAHKNKHHSLFSDSTAYFLTWNLSATGKRMQVFKENNILSLPPEAFHLNESLQIQASEYNIGLHYPIGSPGAESYLSAFDYGEGWTGTAIREGQSRDLVFSGLQNVAISGPKPVIEVLLTGRNNLSHNVNIQVGPNTGSLRTIQSIGFQYYYDTLVINTIEWSDISAGTMVCRISVNNLGTTDRVSISYAKLTFAQILNHTSTQQKTYFIPGSITNRSYLEIQNVPLGSQIYDITDPANVEEIGYNVNGSMIDAVIKNNANGRKLLITSRRIPAARIRPAGMRNIHTTAEFVIITNKLLRKPAGSYTDIVKAYGGYRASAAGGAFDTLIVNVDQLYNMFSYGEITPLAIHRFTRFMAEKGNPRHFFIIGKGLTPNYNFYRRDFDSQAVKDMVPTAGYPGSDILYTSGLKGSTHEPGIPIGRIASKSPAEVLAYFEKVKEAEALANNELWMKELVHLSGGSNPAQQELFKRYVNNFKQIAEGPLLGGKVSTISKESTGTTEIVNISDLVNAGKMLLTFFGHSASETTDLDIGLVSNDSYGYNNKGKYPFMFVNGCIAGDMYNTGLNGFGEDWINTANKGAIGFTAHSGAGLTTLLKWYADIFYEVAFTDSVFLNKSAGEILRETGRRYLLSNSGARNIAQVQQMALQGDPVISIFGASKPDYEINTNNVFSKSIDGQSINVFSDFQLGMIIRNFGRTNNQPFHIIISRNLDNGVELRRDTISVDPVYYSDTIYFDVASMGVASAGNNIFNIQIDGLNAVDELSEANNTATYSMAILGDITKNLSPYNFAVTDQMELQLIAQALDVLGGERTFLFELDTTTSFNSPYRKQTSLGGQVVAKWPVNIFDGLPPKDTITIYWRTKFADISDPQLDIWNLSSFTYISNSKTGWGMAHFEQFEGNELERVVLNDAKRTWEFEKFETTLQLRTFGSNHQDYNFNNVQLIINNTEYIFPTRLCTDNSMNFVAFDQSTSIPYLGLGNPSILDRKSCGRIPQIVNNMLKNEIEVNLHIEQYINNVGMGDFVLAFSIGSVTYQSWPATTLEKLEEIGVSMSAIQGLSTGEPIIILGKKGMSPGEALVVKADYSSATPASGQEIYLQESIAGQAISGMVYSPKIGPASSWDTFVHSTRITEFPQTDNYSFNIYGIDRENQQNLFFENISQVQIDLQTINAGTYPFMRIEMKIADEVNLTPAQLKNWFVFYEGFPEGVLTYKQGQPVREIQKMEGEIQTSNFTFENISGLGFSDSVSVEYSLFNVNNRRTYTDTITIKPVMARESVDFSITMETLGKAGSNNLRVFANPYLLGEQDYNNNFIDFEQYLIVDQDMLNPILEVTVDGSFIMDGDIVSPTPMIALRLKDDNSVLLKEDTLGVNLFLNRQCESCTAVRVNFSSPNVIWTPATVNEDFKVEYQPEQLADGIYTLKAEASDGSGNASGTAPYSVNFEVVNESQITNFFPYPNPFSSRTQFVFTLTGSDIPDDIIIQIMTVNGTVVREITKEEIGLIKIGNNRTEYAWDGRDEYGDQLANGVYLYRVKIYTNGREMKHRATSADRAFEHGFGKLYLLR
jgi:hypothetical protein